MGETLLKLVKQDHIIIILIPDFIVIRKCGRATKVEGLVYSVFVNGLGSNLMGGSFVTSDFES